MLYTPAITLALRQPDLTNAQFVMANELHQRGQRRCRCFLVCTTQETILTICSLKIMVTQLKHIFAGYCGSEKFFTRAVPYARVVDLKRSHCPLSKGSCEKKEEKEKK